MSNCFHLDFETYSRADIRKVGAHRYAEDPSTLILLCAIAKGNGPPMIWDCTNDDLGNWAAGELIAEAASDPANIIYAHNAPFEAAITKNLWGKTFGFTPPNLSQWRCTAAMARRAALPSALDELGAVLKLGQQKDKRGEQLIKIFCSPRTAGKLKGQRIMPTDEGHVTVMGEKMLVSEAWELFRGYCLQDVVTEQHVHKALAPFELRGSILKSFQFDLRMNERGVPVNIAALKKAQVIIDEGTKCEVERFNELTGLNPGQTGKFLVWMRERGYPELDLQEGTMEAVLNKPPADMDQEAVEALGIRARVSFAAVKKIPAMLKIACADGRVRGSLLWSGAIRTHRWSGKLIQPQNFKRPPKHLQEETGEIYQAIQDGWDHEMIGMVWGNPIEAVAACIRHFIQEPDCEFVDADYSNIEARIVPWLAGQEDLLQAFRDGLDPYVVMASKVFAKPIEEVDSSERFVGKQLILGAGYQLGWEKFQAMCLKYGRELDDELCETAIKVYREENDQIVSLWKAMQRAAVDAISNPDKTYKVRGKITFGMAKTLSFPALLARLPSGHHLVYPWPGLERIFIFDKGKYPAKWQAERARDAYVALKERKWKREELTVEEYDKEVPRVWESQSINFHGPDPKTFTWGKRYTYGGSLTENCWVGETEVLTPHGWRRIDSITTEKVFDGAEFVSHQGVKKSFARVVEKGGLWATPEHRILTKQGWTEFQYACMTDAHETAKIQFNRSNLWVPDCFENDAPGWEQKGKVVMSMQMWWNSGYKNVPCKIRSKSMLQKVPLYKILCSWFVQAPHTHRMASNVAKVYKSCLSSLEALRRAWDHYLQKVGLIPQLFGGYGTNMEKGAFNRATKQFKGLQPTELYLGHTSRSNEEHQKECCPKHALGKDVRSGRCKESRDSQGCPVLQNFSRMEREEVVSTKQSGPVYDLINCGPRHQYVVRGANKRPIIAHNCTQAIAGDFITHGALETEQQGYDNILLIHDQALAQFHPERGNTAEGFKDALCKLPPWAQDFPLAATVSVVPYYLKD